MAVDEIGMAATKLRPPAPPTRLVERTRLDVILDSGIRERVPLVLISAPAGSGKSTLVASWAAAQVGAVAWLQVEDSDSDPARFWSSLVAAVGRCRPDRPRLGSVVNHVHHQAQKSVDKILPCTRLAAQATL